MSLQLTKRPPSCRTAHDWAVSSICIVVHHKPIKRAWAFQIESIDFAAASGERSEAAAAAAAKPSSNPDGNHGEYITSTQAAI
jgi:hypothetical protein